MSHRSDGALAELRERIDKLLDVYYGHQGTRIADLEYALDECEGELAVWHQSYGCEAPDIEDRALRASIADTWRALALRHFVAGDERGASTRFRSAKLTETVL